MAHIDASDTVKLVSGSATTVCEHDPKNKHLLTVDHLRREVLKDGSEKLYAYCKQHNAYTEIKQSKIVYESQYLMIEELPPRKKTKRWGVLNKDGDDLGEIKWHAPWRQYCYYPAPQIILAVSCQKEITAFNEAHKNDKVE